MGDGTWGELSESSAWGHPGSYGDLCKDVVVGFKTAGFAFLVILGNFGPY